MIFHKIFTWYKESKNWHVEHEAAWKKAFEKNSAGFNIFQLEIESRIRAILNKSNYRLINRKTERTYNVESEWIITAKIDKLDLDVWIYDNQADISGEKTEFRLEEWDVKTPDEYYEKIEKYLSSVINGV